MGILKIGVVGCGRIGKLHINNLINSVPGVQVVAAADPMLDKSGAREWLAERKITNVSTDFMDVINNPEVDVVFVCSSTDTHCDVSMAAVQAGKHVFCEKPIDYDIDKIKKLLALVEEKGVKFQVGFNRRFDHNHRAVYDMVRGGKTQSRTARSAIRISLSFPPVTRSRPRLPTLQFPAVSSTI